MSREQAMENAFEVVASAARTSQIKAIKEQAKHNPYQPKSLDSRIDFQNFCNAVERNERQRQFISRHQSATNYFEWLSVAGDRLALRLHRMRVYPDLARETEAA